MSRIAETFASLRREGRTGLVTYTTAGDPNLARSAEILKALDRAGADVLEVGVPFSDPLADGPVIQRATERGQLAGEPLLEGRVRRLDRHRFLQQQMQPPVEDRAGQIGMGRMRHGDDGRIQLGLRQHLGRAGEDTLRRNLEALGRAIAILRIGIGDASDDGIRIGLQGRQMGPGRPPAAADDPDLRAHASSTRCRRNSS
jgi:hypothetical protein